MKKIKSGIYGLNPLLDGGINENSTTVVIGASGAGKTTFATQFIRRGLESGQEGIFVSLDENKDEIIREAIEMGWREILDYLDNEKLVFIDASGKEFSSFIRKELPSFVADWGGADARISIDPLTPVMWSVKDQYERRDLIGFLLKQARRVGTVLCTLEEHGSSGDLSGPETIIPMYLADCVVHLRYRPIDGAVSRTLKIVKCRSSRHSDQTHQYSIIRGLGLIVERGNYKRSDAKKIASKLREDVKRVARDKLPPHVRSRLSRALKELTDDDFKGIEASEILEDIIEEYENG
ncbi:MAG: RAD55 family ATPase [Thermoplasmata archaeon]